MSRRDERGEQRLAAGSDFERRCGRSRTLGLTSRPLRLFSCWPASWRSGSGSGASGAARFVATRIATKRSLGRTGRDQGAPGDSIAPASFLLAVWLGRGASRERERRRGGRGQCQTPRWRVHETRCDREQGCVQRSRTGIGSGVRVGGAEGGASSRRRFERAARTANAGGNTQPLRRRRARNAGLRGARRDWRSAHGAREADEAELARRMWGSCGC